jgi:matrixin
VRARVFVRHCVLHGALIASVASMARPARAYCRTTTCDPELDALGCAPVDDCATRGESLFWPDACVTYAVHLRGSPLRGISAYELDVVMRNAFLAWLAVDCPGGGKPSLGVIPLGGASCDRVEFNPPELGRGGPPNANIVMFRDEAWPYPDERFVIARTSLTFDPTSGAIYDADIEINSFDNEFSTDDEVITTDLQAVLTHEVGHFIGLDHSTFPNATMQSNYDLFNLGARTLSSDDIAGVCSIYAPLDEPALVCPPGTGPRNGFSRDCETDERADASCLSLATSSSTRSAWLGVAFGALAWARRRRRCAC